MYDGNFAGLLHLTKKQTSSSLIATVMSFFSRKEVVSDQHLTASGACAKLFGFVGFDPSTEHSNEKL